MQACSYHDGIVPKMQCDTEAPAFFSASKMDVKHGGGGGGARAWSNQGIMERADAVLASTLFQSIRAITEILS